MWLVGIIILLILYTYFLLFLGWHIPNHLTEKSKPPYYMMVLSILYIVILLMATIDLLKHLSYLKNIDLLFEIGCLLIGGAYLYAIYTRKEGGNVSYITRIIYGIGFGLFIFGMIYAVSSELLISIVNGILALILCLLPIPHWLDKYLTPPSKESTAWYAVLHKFKHPRKEE